MTNLFREEALEHHARGARPGEPLRLADRTARRAFVALVMLLVAVAVLVAVSPGTRDVITLR